MKKLYTLIAVALAAAGSVMAQGTVFLNNYDSGKGIFNGNATTAAPVGTQVEVLGGLNSGALAPIATALGVSKYTITAGDLNANGANSGSFFDYGFGGIPTVAPGATATLLVRAWMGAATYDTALTKGSVTWTQATGTAPPAPNLPAPTILAMPSTLVMQTIPEPSAIVLGIVGAAALLLRRRK
jgi:hypothetical protein